MNVVQELRTRAAHSRRRGRKLPKLKRPRRMQYPMLLERSYQRDIEAIARKFSRHLLSYVMPAVRRAVHSADKTMPEGARLDDWPDDVNDAFDDAEADWERQFDEDQVKEMAKRYAEQVAAFNKKQVVGAVQTMVGFDVYLDEPYLASTMDAFAMENASLITSIPEDELDQVKELVFREVRAGTRIEDIGDQIEQRFEVSANRAKFIGRDQTNKLNGDLNRLRQTSLGIEKYTWRGVMDDLERDSHVAHEGEVYRWDDPPADTGNPGEDYNCRCWAEPVIEDEDYLEDAA